MLQTNKIYKEILQSLTMEFARMKTYKPVGKRAMDGDEEDNMAKKQKVEDYQESNYKHYIIDKANWVVTPEQIQTLFKKIRIMVLDNKVDSNNNKQPHYHILGEAKFSPRYIRDAAVATLHGMGIRGGIESKNLYGSANINNVKGPIHWNNIIAYLKKKDVIYVDNDAIEYSGGLLSLWQVIDERKTPQKFATSDMEVFRYRYPIIDSWKKEAAQLNLDSKHVKKLMDLERQRKFEEGIRELTLDEQHELLPNMPILAHAKNLRDQLIGHDTNSGVCLVLCGSALMCKSTINRVIASSLGEYHIWPGSQWIAKDMLKFDSAARQGISTIVVEEMQWIDVQHKISLDKTMCSIKEQLTGAGINVRMAKTKTNVQDDITLKISNIIISMNNDHLVNYNVLQQLINSKPEFKRRFLIINMDDPKYSDIVTCRNRTDSNWKTSETR